MNSFLRTLIKSALLSVSMLLVGTSAKASTCNFYQIKIQGTVASSASTQQFLVNQYAMWRNQGVRANRLELVLTTLTDLNVAPQVGQISLLSNSAFANNAGVASAQLDLASVTVLNESIQVQLDPQQSLILPPSNVFIAPGAGTAPGGLGGLGFLTGAGADLAQIINSAPVLSTYYITPRNGVVVFATPNNGAAIVGQIDITGSGIDNSSLQGRYVGSFSGNYIGSVACD